MKTQLSVEAETENSQTKEEQVYPELEFATQPLEVEETMRQFQRPPSTTPDQDPPSQA